MNIRKLLTRLVSLALIAVFLPTVAHRVQLSPKAESQGKTVQQVLKAILDATPAPRLR